jgi:hypothetical protein
MWRMTACRVSLGSYRDCTQGPVRVASKVKSRSVDEKRSASQWKSKKHSSGGTLTRQTSGFGTGSTRPVPSEYAYVACAVAVLESID